jgi:hypothetical protein
VSTLVAFSCPPVLVAMALLSEPGPPAVLTGLPGWLSWLDPALPWICWMTGITLLSDQLENRWLRELTER